MGSLFFLLFNFLTDAIFQLCNHLHSYFAELPEGLQESEYNKAPSLAPGTR